MNKIILSVFILMLAPQVWASGNTNVDVVVAGYISHGPMQPTVQAIKDVTSKYGDQVNVTWVDLGTAEGQKYFEENGLTAHLNVIINGRYQYNINGKEVTFQWFEGNQWTKEDLDAVISDILSGQGGISPVEPTEESTVKQTGGSSNLFYPAMVVLAAAAAGIGLWIARRR